MSDLPDGGGDDTEVHHVKKGAVDHLCFSITFVFFLVDSNFIHFFLCLHCVNRSSWREGMEKEEETKKVKS